jgi:hypothetical protein
MITCDKDISPLTGTGKYYVGKTINTDLQKYLKEQLKRAKRASKAKPYLYNAMRKYDNPTDWHIHSLMSTLPSDPEIQKWEIELIALFRTRDPQVGYNLTAGGDGGAGGKRTEETKKKMSEAAYKRPKGQVPWNKGTRGLMTAWNKGKKATEAECTRLRSIGSQSFPLFSGETETKRKVALSKAKMGHPVSAGTRI